MALFSCFSKEPQLVCPRIWSFGPNFQQLMLLFREIFYPIFYQPICFECSDLLTGFVPLVYWIGPCLWVWDHGRWKVPHSCQLRHS